MICRQLAAPEKGRLRPPFFVSGAPVHSAAGFTMVELVLTLVILGILAVYVAPRFFETSVFQSRGFADQVQTALRYAQKAAIAKHGSVCATYSAGQHRLTLTIFNTTCSDGGNLNLPGSSVNYIDAPAGVTFSMSGNVKFDALGRPDASVSATVDSTIITVEAETGYVHQ